MGSRLLYDLPIGGIILLYDLHHNRTYVRCPPNLLVTCSAVSQYVYVHAYSLIRVRGYLVGSVPLIQKLLTDSLMTDFPSLQGRPGAGIHIRRERSLRAGRQSGRLGDPDVPGELQEGVRLRSAVLPWKGRLQLQLWPAASPEADPHSG